MRKLHRGRCLELSVIGAALALIAALPAGALAATEESGGGSTPGEAVVESPGGSTEPAVPAASSPAATAPASPGWTSEGASAGTPNAGTPPIRRGSSVGSGGAPEKARSTGTGPSPTTGSTSEGPSYVTGSSGSYEPSPSTPAGVEGPASAPLAESQIRSVDSPATPAGTGRDVELAVGGAAALALSRSPRDDSSSGSHVAGVTLSGPGDEEASGSYVLPLLVVVVLALLGYAGLRLWHRHQKRRLEAIKRRRADTWEAVVRQIETRRAIGALEPSAERLQKIDVG